MILLSVTAFKLCYLFYIQIYKLLIKLYIVNCIFYA